MRRRRRLQLERASARLAATAPVAAAAEAEGDVAMTCEDAQGRAENEAQDEGDSTRRPLHRCHSSIRSLPQQSNERLAALPPSADAPRQSGSSSSSAGSAAAAYDEVDDAIKASLKIAQNDADAALPPLPPAQIAAAYDEMEAGIKEALKNTLSDDEAPLHPAQVAATYEEMDDTIKHSLEITRGDNDVPLPPSLVGAFVGDSDDDEEYSKMKSAPKPGSDSDEDAPPVPAARPPPEREREVDIHRAQLPSAVPLTEPPSLLPPNAERTTTPPVPVPALPTQSSVPLLEATLVEDPPDIPIYDAVQVPVDGPESWLKKHQKYICGGGGLLLGLALSMVGVSLSSGNSTQGEVGIESEGLVPRTIQPLESPFPTQVPSLRSTLYPSHSANPSQSRPPTLGPSLSAHPSTSLPPTTSTSPNSAPSLRPSFRPSTSQAPAPHLFCGEVNVFTDRYPSETTWTLSRIITTDGVIRRDIVNQGSPKDEGHHVAEVCLGKGEYEFTIFDSKGDGICCSRGEGSYYLTIDEMVVAQGSDFDSNETVPFSLPSSPSEAPSSSFRPSFVPSSVPNEHPSFSLQPSYSLLPSPSPSSRPTLQPSQSFSPSRIPSISWQPSPLPSSPPTTPPTTSWSTLNWKQQGNSMTGDTQVDRLGQSVAFSADGTILAIGAPGRWVDRNRQGHVKVYRRDGDGLSWTQRGDSVYGEVDGDNFGHTVKLSGDGNTLSIGAPRNDSNGRSSGQVKVYRWDEADLQYKQIGDALCGNAANYIFGTTLGLSLDGKTLAIVARRNEFSGSNSGQVKVYTWDEAASKYNLRWQAINDDAADDRFGWSISLSGDGSKLAIVSPANGSNISKGLGQVKVFGWDAGALSYTQVGDSIIGAYDFFGRSLSFSGDGKTLAIGASSRGNVNGEDLGQVQVYGWDEATLNYEQLGQNINGKAAGGEFGRSVVLSSDGNTLAIGALQGNSGKPGYVEVYGWDGVALGYKQLGKTINGEADHDKLFGSAVALSADGKVLGIGAPFNDENGYEAGQVEVYSIEF